MKKCPTCEGSGRYYEPSDGYENSKRGRCFDCGGDGTFLSFSKRMLQEYTFKLKSYKESLIFYQEETPKLEQFLKEMNEAIAESSELDSWLNELYAYSFSHSHPVVLDFVFDKIDDFCLEGKFKQVDFILQEIEEDKINEDMVVVVLVCFLAITKRPSDQNLLSNRTLFLERVEKKLKDLVPERVENILKGLI